MAVPLLSLTPKDIGYNLEKLYMGISSNYALTKLNFNEITGSYTKIKETLEKRNPIKDSPGLYDVVRQLDYILDRLSQWVDRQELASNKDAEVFLTAFEFVWAEFLEILEEIDAEQL